MPQPIAVDAGGLTRLHITSASGNNLTQVKDKVGQIYFISALSLNPSPRYLKIFNLPAASVTPGTTVANDQYPIPGNASVAGFNINIIAGLAYDTGITVMITGGPALNDNTPINANEVFVNIGFK
jgi:hypothetical protein